MCKMNVEHTLYTESLRILDAAIASGLTAAAAASCFQQLAHQISTVTGGAWTASGPLLLADGSFAFIGAVQSVALVITASLEVFRGSAGFGPSVLVSMVPAGTAGGVLMFPAPQTAYGKKIGGLRGTHHAQGKP